MENISFSNSDSSGGHNQLIGMKVFDKSGNKALMQSVHQTEDATIAVLELEEGNIINTDFSSLEMREGYFYSALPLEDRQLFLPPGLQNEIKIPVMEEELNVDIRKFDTGKGVRVKKDVLEHEETINVPHTEEVVTTEHIKVGKIISDKNLPQARQEGDTLIVPVLEEIYVLEKKVLLKEEVRITRTRKTTSEVQKIRLRSEQVTVDRFDENAGQDNIKNH